ncbi:MAG: putative kinase inhibitor [Methanoregula sp. PtaU1.Bin051]|nr:MAG: putative kinase inhibitor [Methanoregula sp. PtaU1.Bin051]
MAVMRAIVGFIVMASALILILFATGCTGTPPAPGTAGQPAAAGAPGTTAPVAHAGAFTLHVDSVANGETLPKDYTCIGSFESPAISWENVPAGTKTLTLIMDDPDAPSGTFTHWIVYNIPPERGSLPRGITAGKEISGGGQQGTNTAGNRGYGAACPPIGPKHRYVFTLYAVDYTMGLPTADRDGIDTMLNGHWIEKAVVTTTFMR